MTDQTDITPDATETEEDLAIQLGLVSLANYKPVYKRVKLDELPSNDSKAMDSPPPTDAFVRSWKIEGQHEAIGLIDLGERGYEIRKGRRRIKAARLLNEEAIWACIWPKEVSGLSGLLMTTTDNALRSNNELSDLAVIRELDKKHKVLDPKQIARLTGISFSGVESRLRLRALFDAMPDIETHVRKGRIAISVAEAMVPLTLTQRAGLLALLEKRLAEAKGEARKKVRLTGRDVHDAKRVQVAAAQAAVGLPNMSLPAAPKGITLGQTVTVADLIAELRKLPPAQEVYVASDAEDNEFHPVYQVTLGSSADMEISTTQDQVVVIWPSD